MRAEAEAVLSVLDLAASGKVELVVSGTHIVEIEKCPFPDRRAHVLRVVAASDVYVSGDARVFGRARTYQAGGVGRLDAFHLASAVDAKADFFCTTDDALLKRGRSVETDSTTVVSPLELVLHLSQP